MHSAFSIILLLSVPLAAQKQSKKMPKDLPVTTLMAKGQALYNLQCAACHKADGTGLDNVAPRLHNTDWVNGDPQRLVSVLLHGLSGPIKLKKDELWPDGQMPAYKHLSDTDLAGVLTYVRQSFGNKKSEIQPALVAQTRMTAEKYKVTKVVADREVRKHKRKDYADGFINLAGINVPKGFKVSLYATVNDARSLCISDKGTVFVGNAKAGDEVYALRDEDGDGVAEKKYVIASGLVQPNGIAFKDGDLYVSEIIRIIKFPNIEKNLANPPAPVVVYEGFPNQEKHAKKYMRFGPDGKLYVPVGADCNMCEAQNPMDGTIVRMNPDGSGVEIFARGVRNSVGFDWHPTTGEFWFTDNGRDLLGDTLPPCEINRVTASGGHYGFPYCHGGFVKDPELGSARTCDEFIKPEWKLGAHAAPLGLRFYRGKMFPPEYQGAMFVCEHGSWNRSTKIGYRLMVGKLKDNKMVSYEPFATGWLDGKEDQWGRPVDIQELPDGSLLLSDDYGGYVYRISYDNSAPAERKK